LLAYTLKAEYGGLGAFGSWTLVNVMLASEPELTVLTMRKKNFSNKVFFKETKRLPYTWRRCFLIREHVLRDALRGDLRGGRRGALHDALRGALVLELGLADGPEFQNDLLKLQI
jgi:hypothetical protein